MILPQKFLKRMVKRAKMPVFSSFFFVSVSAYLTIWIMTVFRNRDRFRDLVRDRVRVRDRDRDHDRVRDIRGHK